MSRVLLAAGALGLLLAAIRIRSRCSLANIREAGL